MSLSKKDQAIKWGISQESVINRFKSKLVHEEDGCINFQGFKWDTRDRYRGINICYISSVDGSKNMAMVKAHRFAYALEYGFDALPTNYTTDKKSKVLNHICGNTRCVNPKHLNIMTVTENSTYRGPKSAKNM